MAKKCITFGGGSDSAEQAYINNWLKYIRESLRTHSMVVKVTFNKDPLSNDINNNDFQFVQSKLEEGVSIITFWPLRFLNWI